MNFADIKVGVYIVLKKQFPCKIIQIKVSNPGKHGHVKKLCTGKDVITDKKYIQIFTHHSHIIVPELHRIDYILINIIDEYLTLMDNIGEIREDIMCPNNDIGIIIQRMFNLDKIVSIQLLTVIVDKHQQYRITNVTEDT